MTCEINKCFEGLVKMKEDTECQGNNILYNALEIFECSDQKNSMATSE